MTRFLPTKTQTDHQAMAWACEAAATEAPGTEVRINLYPARGSGEAVARGIRTGNIRAYRPMGSFDAGAYPAEGGTAVWARFVAGLGLEPLPQELTVRVPDYGRQAGYEGVRVVSVQISARCLVCGGPRGALRPDSFVRDGVRLQRDAWTNPCGHADDYTAVLKEARRRQELGDARIRLDIPGGDLKGIEGGAYCRAVDLIAERLATWPWLSALGAINLLTAHGEHDAADAVHAYRTNSHSGPHASGKGAARFLNYCDRQAAQAATETTGDVK